MSVYSSGLKPLWDHVVIEVASQREVKRGELYIPETANDNKPMQGTVVAIGPGKDEIDMTAFQEGTKVLFRQYSGTEFERDGKKYLVLRAGDVMCEVIE